MSKHLANFVIFLVSKDHFWSEIDILLLKDIFFRLQRIYLNSKDLFPIKYDDIEGPNLVSNNVFMLRKNVMNFLGYWWPRRTISKCKQYISTENILLLCLFGVRTPFLLKKCYSKDHFWSWMTLPLTSINLWITENFAGLEGSFLVSNWHFIV